jgi:hypothetical protein
VTAEKENPKSSAASTLEPARFDEHSRDQQVPHPNCSGITQYRYSLYMLLHEVADHQQIVLRTVRRGGRYCCWVAAAIQGSRNRGEIMPRRLLVVVTTEVAEGELRKFVRSRAGDDAEIRVVAPASDISRLDWLTNAEDDARDEAASLAAKTAEATPTDDVDARVGDSDPVKAIEDALRTFAADEILVVARPDDQAGWLEAGSGAKADARFSLPVIRAMVGEDGSVI